MDVISYSLASKQAKRIEKFIENPDSPSGVLTVPSVILEGEIVTIPAGRTAVLPNVTVSGTLNIEGTAVLPNVTVSGTLNIEGDVFVPAGSNITNSKIILVSPNLTRWELTVDNLGNLTTTEVV